MKNKMWGLLFILLGAASTLIDGDATFFVFALVIGLGEIFSKEDAKITQCIMK